MKKILALALVLCLVWALASCTEVTRISIEDPQRIMVEKAGGTMAITLTDPKTVDRITDVVCQLPLQKAEPSGDAWTYRIQWQDASGKEITTVTLAGGQLTWGGNTYSLGIGVDISVVTDQLESLAASLPQK